MSWIIPTKCLREGMLRWVMIDYKRYSCLSGNGESSPWIYKFGDCEPDGCINPYWSKLVLKIELCWKIFLPGAILQLCGCPYRRPNKKSLSFGKSTKKKETIYRGRKNKNSCQHIKTILSNCSYFLWHHWNVNHDIICGCGYYVTIDTTQLLPLSYWRYKMPPPSIQLSGTSFQLMV